MFTRPEYCVVEAQKLCSEQTTQGTPKNFLQDLMKDLKKVRVDDPLKVFEETEEDLEKAVKKVEYGVLAALDGTWVSYNKRPKEWQGSGIHTTIMPSPGTTPDNIPGKFAFVCEEYIEKLTFTPVPGGIRNRGGATELFCGAVKYEQSINSASKQNETLKYVPIHEETGMYLWLSDVYNHPATKETIKRDRGIHKIDEDQQTKFGITGEYRDEPWVKLEDKVGGKDVYIPYSDLKGQKYTHVVPQQELKPGDGIRGPHFIPDYAISRSGVIPHGSTVTLLGEMINKGLQTGSPLDAKDADGTQLFPKGVDAWENGNSLKTTVSPTMGGPGNDPTHGPIDLDKPKNSFPGNWVEDPNLTEETDKGSNLIYVQRIFAHALYPYSVRPDIRLRHTLDKQKVKDFVHIKMFTQKATGAQGGIINVPFVKRFVNTVDTTFDLFIETVIETGDDGKEKEVLQLQYVQVVHFEFHFGNGGGTTSWPHIQVNTLRKLEDVPQDQRDVIQDQFKDNFTIREKDQQQQNRVTNKTF